VSGKFIKTWIRHRIICSHMSLSSFQENFLSENYYFRSMMIKEAFGDFRYYFSVRLYIRWNSGFLLTEWHHVWWYGQISSFLKVYGLFEKLVCRYNMSLKCFTSNVKLFCIPILTSGNSFYVDIESAVGVTGREGMLTPPWHRIRLQ
jgi:hypothetical protein